LRKGKAPEKRGGKRKEEKREEKRGENGIFPPVACGA
jgi:hypothetical protein